jgi:hypothetical protein
MKAFYLSSIAFIASAVAEPNLSKSPNFRIIAVPPPDQALSYINSWNLTSYHISPCDDRAVLIDSPGRTFYTNGTSSEYAEHAATLHSDGGTPPFPWSVTVADSETLDDEGRRTVSIGCSDATSGVQVAYWPGTVYYGTGTFYVCEAELLYGPAMALFYKEKVDQTPDGCINVELQAWCEDGGAQHDGSRDETCYLAEV